MDTYLQCAVFDEDENVKEILTFLLTATGDKCWL